MANTQTDSFAANCGTAEGRLQLLYNLGLLSLAGKSQDELLKTAVQAIAEQLAADHCYTLLKDDSGELAIVVSQGNDASTVEELVRASYALPVEVMKTGEGFLIENTMENQRFFSEPDLQRFNIKHAICLPIKTRQSLFGVIYADTCRDDCDWGAEQLDWVKFVGLYIGMTIGRSNSPEQTSDNQRLIAAGQAALNISHSVKNILQLIGGAVEVIDFGLRTNQIHRVKRSWSILKPNLERVRKFTLDMLDFSKERHLEPGPCDFNSIVQGAIESLKAQLKQKKTKLHVRVDQAIPTVELDGERIHEMALNLILNAIDIVDKETGIVTVETRYLPSEEAVELSVTDNGPGLTEETKEKIFLPFKSTKNKIGTGLGMAIAKQIIDQHKGRIEIETQLGEGSTFKVILPAKVV